MVKASALLPLFDFSEVGWSGLRRFVLAVAVLLKGRAMSGWCCGLVLKLEGLRQLMSIYRILGRIAHVAHIKTHSVQ